MTLPCNACGGSCCFGHRGVLLDDGTILPFVDGRCPHLGSDNRCTIYETRPRGCRDFDCSKEPSFLRVNPRIAALLTVHNVPYVVQQW